MFLTKIHSNFFFFFKRKCFDCSLFVLFKHFRNQPNIKRFKIFLVFQFLSFFLNLKASVFAAAPHLFRTYLQRNSNTFQNSFSDFYGTWVVSFLNASMKQHLDRYISFDFVFPLLSWSSELWLSPCCHFSGVEPCCRERCESFFLAIIFGVWNDLDFLVNIYLFSLNFFSSDCVVLFFWNSRRFFWDAIYEWYCEKLLL